MARVGVSDELLATLLDQVQVGVVGVDHSGRVTHWNAEAEALLGIAAADVMGSDIVTLLATPEREEEGRRILASVLGGRPWQGELVVISGSGADAVMQVRSAPVRDTSGRVRGVVSAFVDATREREAKESLALQKAAADRVETLQQVTARLLEATTLDEVATVILGFAGPLLGAVRASLALVEQAGEAAVATAAAAAGRSAVPAPLQWSRVPLSAGTLVGAAAGGGEPLWVGTLEALQRALGEGARDEPPPGEGSWAALPLTTRRGVLGALSLSYASPQEFPPADRDLLVAMAGQCAIAVERARYHDQAESGRARLRLLASAGEVLASSLDWGETLEAVVGLPVPGMADWSGVHLGGRDGVRLAALRHAEPARAQDLLQRLEGASPPLGGPRAMSVELAAHGEVLGHLSLGRDSGQPFTEDERQLARDLGRRAALALAAARELERRREAAERTLRLQRVTAGLAQALTERRVAAVVLEEAQEGLHASGGGFGLVDASTGEHSFPWTFGWRDPGAGGLGGSPPPRVAALAAQALRLGEPVFGEGLAVLPLVGAESSVGTLSLSFPVTRHLVADERAFLGSLASQAAQAIDRVRLYQAQRRVAAVLQRSLLPDRLPTLPGLSVAARYLPGTVGVQVGGDWYDVFLLGQRKTGLVIGDVVGHDLAAAGSMGRLRAQLRACAHAGGGPGQAIAGLDGLVRDFEEQDVATLACAVWDPAASTVGIALAGHPPPLWLDDDGACFVGPAPGPPVGACPTRPLYEVATVPVGPGGATLVLYTDGLVERRGSGMEQGMEALRAAAGAGRRLEPGDLADSLVDALLHDREREDDVALLVCRLGSA